MEVMSLICSGEHSKALKVIANQSETIEKIKSQFDFLVSLVELKGQMVEPTFISISTYNAEMGDWIIQKFLSSPSMEQHASLCSKIVVCDKDHVSERLQMVQDKVLDTLELAASTRANQTAQIEKVLPFVEMYVRTCHGVANELEQEVFFSVDHGQLIKLLSLLSDITPERKAQSEKLERLIVLLMSPPLPFHNKSINPEKLFQQLMAPDQDASFD